MSSKIRILSDHTINKIAAGEVVENPASVIKELVENSIDAGATEIRVEVKGGGRHLIRVIDNGCGMSADDALLCFERHGTSKIVQVEDLDHISSMGFRGEALPSVASISKVMLLTCLNDPLHPTDRGTMVIVEGGAILQCSPVITSPGTVIEIKSLFFNVPVRLKFQKSPVHDTTEILKVMTLLALGYPEIKFQLVSNQQILLDSAFPSSDLLTEQLKERISSLLGADFLATLCAIDSGEEQVQLKGFISSPSTNRQNKTGQYLFINKRAVVSPLISYAIREGYGPSLPANRYPLYILHLTLPGSLVDINVHPQKKEVRLRHEQDIKTLLIQATEKALTQISHSSTVSHSAPSFSLASSTPSPVDFLMPESISSSSLSSQANSSSQLFSLKEFQDSDIYNPLPLRSRPLAAQSGEPWLFQAVPSETTLKPRLLFTLPGYILIEAKSLKKFANQLGFCIVDQRAAHARVIYERLKNATKEPLAVQQLLLPYTLETTLMEAAILKEQVPNLCQLGISIKEAGPTSFIIDAIPQIFGQADLQEVMKDFLKAVLEDREQKIVQQEQNRLFALSASRTAVKKSQTLSHQEAQKLVEQLIACESPYHCPQGKLTILHFSPEDLMKHFQQKT